MRRYIEIALIIASVAACHAQPSDALPFVFGGERPARLHTPESMSDEGAPLLVVLHGYGSTGEDVLRYSDVLDAANRVGALVVAPEGNVDSNGAQFWNGGACCDFDGSGVDDAGYIESLAAEIAASWNVRTTAVIGFGAGGFLTYQVFCSGDGVISRFASIGGAAPVDATSCTPRPIESAVHIHGDADLFTDYNGTAEQPGALASAALIAASAGCAPLPVTVDRIDLDADVEGAETRVASFPNCDNQRAVELWTRERSERLPTLTPVFADVVVDALLR